MNSLPEEYQQDLAIIRETSQQIIKDFNIDGFEINLSGTPILAFEELKAQITPHLKQILKGDKTAFKSLLYRIDVSEKEYREAFKDNDAESFEERLAEIIIRREFKKVLIRRYHSGKG